MGFLTFSENSSAHLHILILTSIYYTMGQVELNTLAYVPARDPLTGIILRALCLVNTGFIHPICIIANTWYYRSVVRPHTLISMDTDLLQHTEIYLALIYLQTVLYPWLILLFLEPYIGK